MVSKVAIIAIVAILAVPILLGYALNVDQVTETDYKTTGDPVNVTPLLKTGIGYDYLNADSYQLNTKFTAPPTVPALPIYEKTTDTKTSFKGEIFQSNPGELPYSITGNSIYYYFETEYDGGSGYVYINILDQLNGGNLVRTINAVKSIYYELSTKTFTYSYYSDINDPNSLRTGSLTASTDQYRAYFFSTSGYNDKCYFVRNIAAVTTKYVDLSAGFHLSGTSTYSRINLPDYTKSAIFTIDLNSITDDNYTMRIGAGGHNNGPNFDSTNPYTLTKTTTAGVVTWTLTSVRDPTKTWDLYYDPAIPHNTYQIYWDWIYDHSGDPYYYVPLEMDFHDMYYTSHREFRYVGNWPDAIGEANVYWKVTDDIDWYVSAPMPYELPDYMPSNYTDYNFSYIYTTYTDRTPTMRVDAASFRAFEYQVIEGRTLDAASFKTNPSTTIDNINAYGPSFTFGGNTYNVKKGNITMGSHEIPVNGLVLSSVPNPEGGYDNKIGNTVISTTAAPSTITFNGRWSASITVTAQEEYEVTKTEWKAGDFAWDGIDHNFIMAGLLASLGAFVGVGIYARRTKSTVWPLLIVCGGAALLFFVML